VTGVVHDRPTVAVHEAGHTAATIMLRGRLPLSVTADRPKAGLAGSMEFDRSDDGIDVRPHDFFVITLAGPLAEGASVPEWPLELDPDRDRGDDERSLAVLASYLKLTEDEWLEVVDRARRLVESEDFNRIARVVARALELADELSGEEVRQLLPARLRTKYLEEVPEPCST
jgi:hypothetical protein